MSPRGPNPKMLIFRIDFKHFEIYGHFRFWTPRGQNTRFYNRNLYSLRPFAENRFPGPEHHASTRCPGSAAGNVPPCVIFLLSRSHSLENPSSKACGKNKSCALKFHAERRSWNIQISAMCQKTNISVYGNLRVFLTFCLLGDAAGIILEICLGTPPRLGWNQFAVIKSLCRWNGQV